MSRDIIQNIQMCPNEDKAYDDEYEEDGRERMIKPIIHDYDIGQQYMAHQAQLMAGD